MSSVLSCGTRARRSSMLRVVAYGALVHRINPKTRIRVKLNSFCLDWIVLKTGPDMRKLCMLQRGTLVRNGKILTLKTEKKKK